MELRSFISTALTDILGGVTDAQEKCPIGSIIPHVKDAKITVEAGAHPIQSIQFEVSVRVDEHSGSKTKISVVAAVLGGSTQAGSDRNNGHVATLRFNVPIKFPQKPL